MIQAIVFYLTLTIGAFSSVQTQKLFPPFLPAATVGTYFEQKFVISDEGQSKIDVSGLPPGLKSTQNGTIYGVPFVEGEWSLKLGLLGASDNGRFSILWRTINAEDSQKGKALTNRQIPRIVVSGNTIVQTLSEFQLELRVQNLQEKVDWKLGSEYEGIRIQSGRLMGKISRSGQFPIHVKVSNHSSKLAETFILLTAKSDSQYKALSEKGKINSELNLLPDSQRDSETTQRLFDSAEKVNSEEAQIKKLNEQLSRVNTDLLSLEDVAKSLSKQIESAQRLKVIELEKNKSAARTLQFAEKQLNLALLEKESNLELLNQAKRQVIETEKSHNIALENWLDAESQNKQLSKLIDEEKTLKSRSEIALRQLQVAEAQSVERFQKSKVKLQKLSSEIKDHESIAQQMKLQLELQTIIMSQESTEHSILVQKASQIEKQLQEMEAEKLQQIEERAETVQLFQDITQQLNLLKKTKIWRHQLQLESNDKAIQKMAMEANSIFAQSQFHSQFWGKVAENEAFEGCTPSHYPIIQGVALVEEVHEGHIFFGNGVKVLFGECTLRARLFRGDLVFIKGHVKMGIIHASSIRISQ